MPRANSTANEEILAFLCANRYNIRVIILKEDVNYEEVLEEKESVIVAGTDYRFIKYKYSGMGINQYHYMYFTQQNIYR